MNAGNADTATNATNATNDSSGNNIIDTYATKVGTLGIFYDTFDFTATNKKPGSYSLSSAHPVTDVTEYGSILNLSGNAADHTYFGA